jgi:hypothetical protein
MRLRRTALVVCLLVLVAGCGLSPDIPSIDRGSNGSGIVGSGGPDPTDVAKPPFVGPWQPSPFALGDPQVATISDACAAAARVGLGEIEANLPTALVDARGEGAATAILADDERAIECRARIDAAGGTMVEEVVRLAPSFVVPAGGREIRLTSLVPLADHEGDRMLVLGRVGPEASGVKLGLDDGSEVFASSANGWYAAWWAGHRRASVIVAVDDRDVVVGTLQAPNGVVVGELGATSWWLDPQAPAPRADSVSIRGFVLERACTSGQTPEGRVERPLFDLTETAVTVVIGIRTLPDGQDCQGNAPFPVRIELPEPLAERALLDGGSVPPRDASKLPAS